MIAVIKNIELYAIYAVRSLDLAKTGGVGIIKERIANCFSHAGFKTKEEYEKESNTVIAQNFKV